MKKQSSTNMENIALARARGGMAGGYSMDDLDRKRLLGRRRIRTAKREMDRVNRATGTADTGTVRAL